jgi:hypothetical protein
MTFGFQMGVPGDHREMIMCSYYIMLPNIWQALLNCIKGTAMVRIG